LRQLGAVDESDPTVPSVIISNYLYSQTNCLAPSGFYSVCCKDECEGLMGHLEEKLSASEAKPTDIATVVSQLPSATVSVPRQISATLMTRLTDISSHHGGVVPVHGRLFAQWMHHAYPRECPYPHISGTTTQQTATEWIAETGNERSDATQEEMLQYTSASNDTMIEDLVSVEELLHWSTEEELLVTRLPPQLPSSPRFAALRLLMLLPVVGSLMFGEVTQVNWQDYEESMPAFLTIVTMAFTFNVGYGIIFGMAMWIVVQLLLMPYRLLKGIDPLVRIRGPLANKQDSDIEIAV